MATEWRKISTGTYALFSGSNIGVIANAERALVIDAGLDKDAARRVLREIDAHLHVRVAALLITHGHADHFGGAATLAKRAAVPVYAPPLEGAIAAHPLLEPLFLYGGAAPIAELQDKFTLARQAAPVAAPLTPGPRAIAGFALEIVPLPGHAPEQIGVAHGDTLYCGDVLFPEETLRRHPILFCYDLDAWLTTLERLTTFDYRWFVPGHGAPLEDVAALTALNVARLREIRALAWEALATPMEAADVLRAVAAHYAVPFAAPQFFLLALTTIHAALTSLQRAGEAQIVMEDNHLRWHRV